MQAAQLVASTLAIWHFFILRGIEKSHDQDFFNITIKASIPPDTVPVAN